MKNTIRVERAKKGITQKKLAEEVGTSRQTIHLVENGKDTQLSLAMKIARFFGVKIEDIWNF